MDCVPSGILDLVAVKEFAIKLATHAAITTLDVAGVKAAFVQALHAARDRAAELGRG